MNKLFWILEDDFDTEVFPPNPPSFLLVGVVQLFALHQLAVVPADKRVMEKSLISVLALSLGTNLKDLCFLYGLRAS